MLIATYEVLGVKHNINLTTTHMKKNMIAAIVKSCTQQQLIDAICAMDEKRAEMLLELATGDVPIYTAETLPKVGDENLIKFVSKMCEGREVVSVSKLTVVEMCHCVNVTYKYNSYKYFNEDHTDWRWAKSERFQERELCSTPEDNLCVDIREYLDFYNNTFNLPPEYQA